MTDGKGYITYGLATCSFITPSSDSIIQFVTFESEDVSGGKWDRGQEAIWKRTFLFLILPPIPPDPSAP
jgi:hypothetical protein